MGWLQRLDLNDNLGSVILQVESFMGGDVDDSVVKRLGDLVDACLKLPPYLESISSLLSVNKYRFSNKGLSAEFCFGDCLLSKRYGRNTGAILYLALAEECNVLVDVFEGYRLKSEGFVVDLSNGSDKSDIAVNRRRMIANHVVDLAGFLFLSQRDLKNEFECYQLAAELDPLNFVALHRLGASCYTVGDYSAALFWFERALNVNPDDVDTLNMKETCNRLYKIK